MKVSLSSVDEIKAVGTPIKELTKDEKSGFQELSAVKDILSPLKELESQDGFQKLPDFKDILMPIKEIISNTEDKESKGEK